MRDATVVTVLEESNNIINKEIIYQQYVMPFQIKIGKNIKVRKALFVLHGHGANKKYAKFYDDEWIVVCPLDMYGTENQGSWWLGEKGNFFTLRLLQDLISYIKKEYNLEEIYFWGSSMGGYGAILHGTICNADAVYAHMPQVKLEGTDYTDGSNKKYYSPLFDNRECIYKDLTEFMRTVDSVNTPVLFLSQNVFDYPNYVRQHFIPLIETLDSMSLAYSVEMNLEKGHKLFRNISDTVENIFNKNSEKIKKWNESEKLIKRSMFNQTKITISFKGSSIFIKNLIKIEGCLFACHLYVNDRLIDKKDYQKDSDFIFNNKGLKENDIVKAIYYVRTNDVRDIRVSKVYLAKF